MMGYLRMFTSLPRSIIMEPQGPQEQFSMDLLREGLMNMRESNDPLEESIVKLPSEMKLKNKSQKIKKLKKEVTELSALRKYIEKENEQLKMQSKKFQEEIEKLQSETRKTNKKMHKMLKPEYPVQRRSDGLGRTDTWLSILINAA